MLGPKPAVDADSSLKLRYLERSGVMIFAILFCLVMAGIGSVMIARQAREEYAEMKESNLRELIEGAKSDIDKKRNG
jgi:multisubunit Na+/H+ antiporter MnhG subunit